MPRINGKPYRWVIDKEMSGLASIGTSRAWPTLECTDRGSDEYVAGYIKSDIAYSIHQAKRTDLNLTVVVYDWSDPVRRKSRASKLTYATLKEAKDALERFVSLYPEFAYNPRSLIGLTK